ncbi:MAG: S41 family peptidase [Patescibacteria group bacterium]
MSRPIKHLVIGFIFPLLLVVAFGGGLIAGSLRSSVAAGATIVTGDAAAINLAPFWKAWQILDDKFIDTHSSTSTVTDLTEKRIWGAISGMTAALGDPYTTFLPPEEKKGFEENISGNFGGVGLEIDVRDHNLTVVTALKDTPAKQAGFKSGDQIIKIDETETSGLSLVEAVKLIRGPVGSEVTITIRRADEPDRPITVTRAKISIPTLETKKQDGVFIIQLYNFNSNASKAFRSALREFIATKSDKLIIDLRGDPGGLLESAVDMASWFLPSGEPVVIERRGNDEEDKIYRSYGYNVFTDKLKLAILIDGGSASASEILAGALSEHGLATLIGEKSFGKGSVQELIPVTKNSSLKVTVAKWLTPKHRSLVDNGLEPDIVVKAATSTPNTADRNNDKTKADDPVLTRAIDFLKHKK